MSRSPNHDSELLGESEVQRLLMAASERAPTGVRNRALVALIYCSGLRLGEALALREEDLDLAGASACVRAARGRRRTRTAHVFPAARPYLETWLALRAKLALPVRAPLFCTLRGAPLEPAYVRAMLARLGRRAGLRKRVHAHGLRHACAVRLGQAGVSGEALAEQLGQASARSARRALRPFGLVLATGGARRARDVPFGLAPQPGLVRALIAGGLRTPRAGASPGRGMVVVRRWVPPEI